MASAEPPEQTLLDRYVLREPFAFGGMATVHLGQVKGARGFARTVAIKRLHPQFAKDPDFSSMLLDEARVAAAIHHPNVVPTLDVVQAEGELFMVMEYVAGESLARLLLAAREVGTPVPPRIGAAILAGALAGLHAAHEAHTEDGIDLQIVHRDVSPQNILVGRDGIPRLVDFGIARAVVRAQATREGQLKGKLRYMAPEQLRAPRDVDRRADIYAAGVVLWEVLTGDKLFDGESDAEVFGNVLEGVVPAPSSLVDVPIEVDQVVLRALARAPGERFATALSMGEALARALPPASAAEVGAWVETLVGPLLAERTAQLAAFEAPLDVEVRPSVRGLAPPSARTGAPSTRGAAGSGLPSVGSAVTQTLMSPERAEAPMLRPAPLGVNAPETPRIEAVSFAANQVEAPELGAGTRRRLGVGAGVVIALLSAGLVAAAFALRDAPEPTSTGVSVVAPPIEPPRVPASEPSPPEVIALPTSPPPTPSAAASASAHPTSAKSRCVPPYYVDGTGIRRVKRGCL